MIVYYSGMRYKDKNKIEAVRQAVLTIVSQKGAQNLSMSKVAKAAGVSPATIYIYYENKEDMLGKVYLFAKTAIDEAMFEGVKETASLENQFKLIFQNCLTFLLKKPEIFEFTRVIQADSTLVNEKFLHEAMNNRAPQTLKRMFETGIKLKQLKDIPEELANAFTFEALYAYADQQIKAGSHSSEMEIKHAVTTAWDAISYK